MKHKIPNHLKQYIVKQNYNQYTYIDQACWRFIMKVSIDFFKEHADNIYIKGLKDTGITVNQIPKISTINKKLLRFGWKAVCVRGFIPPQAFMEIVEVNSFSDLPTILRIDPYGSVPDSLPSKIQEEDYNFR